MILPSILTALLVPFALAAPVKNANAPRRLTSLPPGYVWKPQHWPPTAIHPKLNGTKHASKRDCSTGSWSCSGNVLQECVNSAWVNMATCSGGLVCSTSPSVGCVYSWQVTSTAGGGGGATTTTKAPATTTTSSAPPVQTVTPGKFNAPHYVIYADSWLAGGNMPSVSQLGGFNRFVLAFDMTVGAVDDAVLWTQLDQNTRTSILNSYHAAGKAIMVSAFGSTDAPTSGGQDPVNLANTIANFVRQWQLDGVDIDYEDFNAVNGGTSVNWLVQFQRALRNNLGPNYLISHAPIAPWFCRSCYSDGAYAAVNDQVGNTIDFYSLQYYNQGSAYTDCNTLLWNSASTSWPYTSIGELNSHDGIPLAKLVLGKPLTGSGASSGYMSPSALGSCVSQGKSSLGWPGSVMFWEWDPSANPAGILNTVAGV